MSPGDLDRTPVYRQIAGHYSAQVRSGAIKPGDKLPSMAELCRAWGIASQTAFETYAVLREEGLVETSRKGTFARAVPIASGQ